MKNNQSAIAVISEKIISAAKAVKAAMMPEPKPKSLEMVSHLELDKYTIKDLLKF